MKKAKRISENKTKYQVENSKAFFAILVTIIITLVVFILSYMKLNIGLAKPVYAMEYIEETIDEPKKMKANEETVAEQLDITQIIDENTKTIKKEEIFHEEEDLEYNTTYKTNKDLPKGTIQVIQEGRDGTQQVITKKYYEGENLVNETIETNITKASLDKIVEIGGASYSSNYKVKVGDTLYVTSSTLAVRVAPENTADKIITIDKNEKVRLLDIQESWYKIKYNSYEGYVPKDCVTYIDPNVGGYAYSSEKSKAEILAGLSQNMSLNKPSGLSLEQFKKVLSGNSQDKNKIFEQNAEYFYYVEKQYNINGIFVASVGIHESSWASSKISLNKKNLFGYGANDNNPYANAKNFSTYAEGIDLVARVFVKYYINAPGTNIYDGSSASGKYYSGSTLADVNKRYASDKNWHNGVYKWMSYLYNRL